MKVRMTWHAVLQQFYSLLYQLSHWPEYPCLQGQKCPWLTLADPPSWNDEWVDHGLESLTDPLQLGVDAVSLQM